MSEAAAAEWQFRKITDPSIRTRYLFLGNVGPGVGVSQATLDELLQPFRPETVVVPFPTAPFVFVVFASVEDAAHATEELEARSVQLLGRKVVAKYSDAKQTKVGACRRGEVGRRRGGTPTAPSAFASSSSTTVADSTRELRSSSELQRCCSLLFPARIWVRHTLPRECLQAQPATIRPVAFTAADLGVPGIELYPEFITPEEEQAYLAAVSEGTWIEMVKRRVQHYGWDFDYVVRPRSDANLPPVPHTASAAAQQGAAVARRPQRQHARTVCECQRVCVPAQWMTYAPLVSAWRALLAGAYPRRVHRSPTRLDTAPRPARRADTRSESVPGPNDSQ